jgi:hypothetical protein
MRLELEISRWEQLPQNLPWFLGSACAAVSAHAFFKSPIFSPQNEYCCQLAYY